jgi:hypothetical protein
LVAVGEGNKVELSKARRRWPGRWPTPATSRSPAPAILAPVDRPEIIPIVDTVVVRADLVAVEG